MKNITGQPARGTDFFDRPNIIKGLWHRLARDHVLLLAPRRAGKTSILSRMVAEPAAGWRSAYLDVEAASSEAHFVAKLLQAATGLNTEPTVWQRLGSKMSGILERVGKVTAGPIEVELTAAIDRDWQSIGTAAVHALAELDGSTALFIDEFPIFVQKLLRQDDGENRGRALLDWFRGLRLDTALAHKVRVLLAGSIGLDAVVNRVGLSGTINDLHPERVPPLNEEGEASRFLQALANGEALALSAEVEARILTLIDLRVPYHLQLLFSEVHRVSNLGEKTVTVAMVDDAHAKLLEPTNRKSFIHWVERLDDLPKTEAELARALLAAAATDAAGITSGTIKQIRETLAPGVHEDALLLNLTHDGYLDEQNGRFRFSSSLLRHWWVRWMVPKL